jgi:hypothetical protein
MQLSPLPAEAIRPRDHPIVHDGNPAWGTVYLVIGDYNWAELAYPRDEILSDWLHQRS